MREAKPSPRRLAVEILTRIDTGGAYAEPLLDNALSGKALTAPPDRALLTELVYGTLRKRGPLDWIIAQLYKGDPATLEATVRNILRTGLYQLWFTDRIPPFAAVNEAVEIARLLVPAAPGLVNGLLRNALRKKDAIEWPEGGADPAVAIAVLDSHPLWLVRRWLAQFGQEQTVAICRANNGVPPVTLRVNTLKGDRAEAIATLACDGFRAEPTQFSPDGLQLLSSAAGLRETRAYREGLFRLQDEASQLIGRLVDPLPGERVLDLCAGAGGKTLHLAALMNNSGTIVALDRRGESLNRLRDDARRLGATIVETRTADAGVLPDPIRQSFDRVLLDAPCSGLGTLRRNPEIRWRLTPKDFREAMQAQRRLLRSAADAVKPGGRLVYSVCTLTPEENELVVNDLLHSRPDFTPLPPPLEHLPSGSTDERGFLRVFTHLHGQDGFFAAVLMRRA